MSPELLRFIDRAIVPALLERFWQQHAGTTPAAPLPSSTQAA